MGSKGFLASATIQGGLLALLPGVGKMLEMFGVIPPGLLDDASALFASTFGGFMAILGRLRAHKAPILKGLF